MLDDLILQNPVFTGMDPQKLQFIMNFAGKAKPQSMQDAMPFLMANMSQAKKENIKFNNSEIKLIADILSKDLPETEKQKVDKIMKMLGT
jgi:hypothetical protein